MNKGSATVSVPREILAKCFSIQARAIMAIALGQPMNAENLKDAYDTHIVGTFLEDNIYGMASDYDRLIAENATVPDVKERLQGAFQSFEEMVDEFREFKKQSKSSNV